MNALARELFDFLKQQDVDYVSVPIKGQYCKIRKIQEDCYLIAFKDPYGKKNDFLIENGSCRFQGNFTCLKSLDTILRMIRDVLINGRKYKKSTDTNLDFEV